MSKLIIPSQQPPPDQCLISAEGEFVRIMINYPGRSMAMMMFTAAQAQSILAGLETAISQAEANRMAAQLNTPIGPLLSVAGQ